METKQSHNATLRTRPPEQTKSAIASSTCSTLSMLQREIGQGHAAFPPPLRASKDQAGTRFLGNRSRLHPTQRLDLQSWQKYGIVAAAAIKAPNPPHNVLLIINNIKKLTQTE